MIGKTGNFTSQVQGATSEDIMQLYDMMIEEGVITPEEFADNELQICGIVDAEFFTCEGCAWTMPISEQDERGGWHCRECMDEEHGYD
jgi:hypothetical protein